MAAPQFFVPPRVTPSRPKRRFSLQQANRTLPLVSRIVTDIVKAHKAATAFQAQMENMPAASKQRGEADRELARKLERLHGLTDELSGVGCEIKDFEMGLIDFVGRHQGRNIHLCWKLGEETVAYWHETDAGFAGRQPVSTLDERE